HAFVLFSPFNGVNIEQATFEVRVVDDAELARLAELKAEEEAKAEAQRQAEEEAARLHAEEEARLKAEKEAETKAESERLSPTAPAKEEADALVDEPVHGEPLTPPTVH